MTGSRRTGGRHATRSDHGRTRHVADRRCQLDKVSDTANGGDLVAAEKALKDAGTSLITLANNLRADADRATAQNLRTTLTDLAGEFETQGKSLDSLSDLQSFDTKRLEAHAARMEALCGLTPSASPSVSPWPSPSPSR